MDKITEDQNTVKISRVSIIILNWNGWQDTVACLESLKNLTYPHVEIIVCDNGSTDGSQEKLEEYISVNQRDDQRLSASISLIKNNKNLGFAGGNNPGIKYALEHGADYVFLLNNDTLIHEGEFLQKLIAVGESDATAGILGPAILYADNPKKVHFAGGKINFWMTKATHEGLGDTGYGIRDKEPYEADYITGAAMLVKREVIEKIGLMEESYFLYYEDSDWCLRARRAGFRCVLVPGAQVLHKVSASTKPGSPSYISYHVRNGLYLAWRNGDLLRQAGAVCWGIVTLLKQPLKLLIPSKRQWVAPTIRGVLDFFQGKTGQII